MLVVSIVGGVLLAHRQNAKEFQAARMSAKGRTYGYIMPVVKLDHPTLRQALTTLDQLSQANMQVDWDGLQNASVPCDRPLNLEMDLRDGRLEELLPMVLTAANALTLGGRGGGAVSEIADDRLLISIPEGIQEMQKPVVRIYDIRDLLAGADEERKKFPDDEPDLVLDAPPAPPRDATGDLIRLIEDTVASETWEDAGGTLGSISASSGRLIITQIPSIHGKVAELLSQLREGSGSAPHDSLPDPLLPEEKPPAALSRSIGDLSLHGVPVKQAVDIIRQRSGANIYVNWGQLSAHNINRDEKIDLSIRNATTQDAIISIVAALNGRTVDWGVRGGFIVISSVDNLQTRTLYPVFYAIDDLVARMHGANGISREAAEANLVKELRRAVAPGSWGKNAPADCEDFVRSPSTRVWAGKLLVVQTRPYHRQIELFLAHLREGK
jgi:hypothetical protein